MRRAEALSLAQQFQDAANTRNISKLLAFYTDDATTVSPVFGRVTGRAAIAATWESIFTTFPDLSVEMSDVLVDGDRLAILGTVTATDSAGWFGLPPTGSAIRYRLVILCTMHDGKIVQDERIYDNTAVLELLEKVRLDKELKTAAEVQRALLSRPAYVDRYCESAGDSIPCRAIGGDFFEFVELPTDEVGIAMGDVVGKGPPAALVASMLQGMFAADSKTSGSPSRMLTLINQRMAARHLESRFVTLVYGVLSSDGRFVYSNGGHNPPACLSGDRIYRFTVGGPLLGAFADAVYEEETIQLTAGDTILMFTDGVTEARNSYDEEFGEDRLFSCLLAHAGRSPSDLLRLVFDEVRGFCQNTDQADDLTVTLTRFYGTSFGNR